MSEKADQIADELENASNQAPTKKSRTILAVSSAIARLAGVLAGLFSKKRKSK